METKNTLKVVVTITVEIDRDAYNEEYGERATANDIREHVRGEVNAAAISAFENIDAITVK